MLEPGSHDEISTEALQAQLDISMGLIHDLASSWAQSIHLPKSSTDSMKELQDHLLRPPRLGVGAPAPEKTALAREGDRLRGRLIGNNAKKRSIDETYVKPPETESSDEGESRAGAIRKRPKLDVFDAKPRSKKKKTGTTPSTINNTPSTLENISALDNKTAADLPKTSKPTPHGCSGLQSPLGASTEPNASHTSKKRKKKRKHVIHEDGVETNIAMPGQSQTPAISPDDEIATASESRSTLLGQTPLAEAELELEDSTTLSSGSRSTKNHSSSDHTASPATQVLNLSGPVQLVGSAPGGKKKRKRKKNKHKSSETTPS